MLIFEVLGTVHRHCVNICVQWFEPLNVSDWTENLYIASVNIAFIDQSGKWGVYMVYTPKIYN